MTFKEPTELPTHLETVRAAAPLPLGAHNTVNPLPAMLEGQRAGVGRVYEKPWHRAAAYHFASGMSVKQVAEANDVHPNTVTALLKTPWFQQHVTDLMNAAGVDSVLTLLRSEGLNSVTTLIELRDSPATPPSVRADTAKEILNRVYGKPVQKLETDATVRSGDPVGEVAALEAENKRLEQQLGLNGAAEEPR